MISLAAAALVLCGFTGRMTGQPILRLVAQAASIFFIVLLISMMSINAAFAGGGLAWGAAVISLLVAIGSASLTRQQKSDSDSLSIPDEEGSPSETPKALPGCFETRLIERLELLSLTGEDDCDEEFEDEDLEIAETVDDRVVTAWTRRRQRDEERLEGSISVEFAPAQKQVYVHVPFMPGFQCRPQAFCVCEADSIYSAEFDILHTYGGRMSVRRRGDASEPAEVDIAISITAPLNVARAA